MTCPRLALGLNDESTGKIAQLTPAAVVKLSGWTRLEKRSGLSDSDCGKL